MENKKKYLMILVIVQSIIILGLVGYVLYDKLSNDNNKVVEDNNINNDKNEEVLLTNDEALEIVKDLTKKYVKYESSLGPYCGDWNKDDYISFGSYETKDFRDYVASSTYKSIDDIKEFFESFMIEDLIPKYLNNGVSYLERDGKLYCQLSHKSGEYYDENDISGFIINSIEDDKIFAEIIWGFEYRKRNDNVEIIKKTNGKWLISKYEITGEPIN